MSFFEQLCLLVEQSGRFMVYLQYQKQGVDWMKNKLLANIFTDGVILQRELPVRIWGKGDVGCEVTITFNGKSYVSTVDTKGSWQVILPSFVAGGPYVLTVKTAEEVQVVNDILIGDVWICSGQSNMEINMLRTRRMFGDYNKNTHNPKIRKYHVPMNYNFDKPQFEIPEATWISAIPEHMEKFSATAFFFANKVYNETGVPIGIILSALGGTPIESWMSRTALSDDPEALAKADLCRKPGYMEKMTREGQKISDAWFEKLNRYDRGLNGSWQSEDFDDQDWKTIDLGTSWDEVDDLKASGSVWLRKVIEIPTELASKSADIILGTIIDADEVYINGEQIGGIGYQYPPRDYIVSNLKPGKNLIAIRVIAVGGTGGFTVGKERKLLFANGQTIDLTLNWKYKRALSCPPPAGGTPFFQNTPIGNYNGMIAPFHNFPIKGVLWYQGESNAGSPEGYSDKLKTLITDWRQNWNQGDFPFIFAQLPNWAPKGRMTNWAYLRDEQAKVLTLVNTRMAVTYDSGEHNDLHPLNKKAVGERLAGEALSLAYGFDLTSTAPTIQTINKMASQCILTFDVFGSNLVLKHGQHVQGLSLWINDIEIPTEGLIINNTVITKAPYMADVTAISYAWSDDPSDANLYNEEGLPAAPFKKQL